MMQTRSSNRGSRSKTRELKSKIGRSRSKISTKPSLRTRKLFGLKGKYAGPLDLGDQPIRSIHTEIEEFKVNYTKSDYETLTNYKLFCDHIRGLVNERAPKLARPKMAALLQSLWKEFDSERPPIKKRLTDTGMAKDDEDDSSQIEDTDTEMLTDIDMAKDDEDDSSQIEDTDTERLTDTDMAKDDEDDSSQIEDTDTERSQETDIAADDDEDTDTKDGRDAMNVTLTKKIWEVTSVLNVSAHQKKKYIISDKELDRRMGEPEQMPHHILAAYLRKRPSCDEVPYPPGREGKRANNFSGSMFSKLCEGEAADVNNDLAILMKQHLSNDILLSNSTNPERTGKLKAAWEIIEELKEGYSNQMEPDSTFALMTHTFGPKLILGMASFFLDAIKKSIPHELR